MTGDMLRGLNREKTSKHSPVKFELEPPEAEAGAGVWPPSNPRPGAGSRDGPASWLAEAACPGLLLAAAAPQQTPLCPGAGPRLPGWLGIRKETQLSPE